MTALDDLRLLRVFVRIAQSGSISAAARGLNMPQPTVSRQLRQLEETAGIVLVRRDTHALSLTPAGHRLLDDAREILNLASNAADRIRGETAGASGHLRIVAVLDTGVWIVSRLLAAFRELHPDITAELHLTNRPSKFIAEGFDCGILAGEITDPSVALRDIARVKLHLLAAPSLLQKHGAPKDPSDLAKLPWMGILQPHFLARDSVKLCCGVKEKLVPLSPVLVMDSVVALREAAVAGAGMAVMPEWMARRQIASGQLIPVLPKWKPRPAVIHLVFPPGRLPGNLRAFVDFVAANFQSCVETVSPAL
jgi:DNA-binding transcriptional LysR family regulator